MIRNSEYKKAIKQAENNLTDLHKRGSDAVGSSWDDVKHELFTPEELARSEAKAARLARRISRRESFELRFPHIRLPKRKTNV